MMEYDDYLKSKSKNELKTILAAIDIENEPERYNNVKEYLVNYDLTHLEEIKNKTEKSNLRKKRESIRNLRIKLKPLFFIIRWMIIGSGILAYSYLSIKKEGLLSIHEVFSENNQIRTFLIILMMGIYSISEGINWTLETAYTGFSNAKVRSIGMIIIGIICIIAATICFNRI